MPIFIANRRSKLENLQQRFKGSQIIDVTSKSSEPWVKFSPFFPHGGIPIPFSEGSTGQSVEGIWQGLKVFENADVDSSKWEITNMRGIKRTTRSNGRVLGHRAGVTGKRLLDYLAARKEIYLPCYRWILNNRLQPLVKELKKLSSSQDLVLLDYETNGDINDLSSPLSHASLIKCFLEERWPI